MIEVEKKFLIDEDNLRKLLNEASFLKQVFFEDTYYENADFSLSTNDMWLRNRDGNFQLKIPKNDQAGERIEDQYHEVEGEDQIREIFAIPKLESFIKDIEKFGYLPFCRCKTERKKYKKDDFVIDVDKVDFGDFTWSVCEIEKEVKDEEERKVIRDIMNLSNKYNMKEVSVRGKVIEYIRRRNPDHYQKLFESGIINE